MQSGTGSPHSPRSFGGASNRHMLGGCASSAPNSPRLGDSRVSPFQTEKNQIIGELASRMKRPLNDGFDKSKRGDEMTDLVDDEEFPLPPSALETMGRDIRASLDDEDDLPLPPPPMLEDQASEGTCELDDEDILKAIGNRPTKNVTNSIGRCGTCKKTILDDGCTAFGQVYHKKCFVCFECKSILVGKFFQKDGHPYCESDYSKYLEICCVCQCKIKGDSVATDNKHYHPGCIKCSVCKEQLSGKYYTLQDQPICEKDYKATLQACCVCNATITGTYYSMNDKLYCEEDYRNQCGNCARCGIQAVGKTVTTKEGVIYHPSCFTCVDCGKDMVSAPFMMSDRSEILCKDDYYKKCGTKCSFCKKTILPRDGETTASRLRALGRDFHPKCFQCEECGLVLDSRVKGRECYPLHSRVLCLKCNRLISDACDDDEEHEEQDH